MAAVMPAVTRPPELGATKTTARHEVPVVRWSQLPWRHHRRSSSTSSRNVRGKRGPIETALLPDSVCLFALFHSIIFIQLFSIYYFLIFNFETPLNSKTLPKTVSIEYSLIALSTITHRCSLADHPSECEEDISSVLRGRDKKNRCESGVFYTVIVVLGLSHTD